MNLKTPTLRRVALGAALLLATTSACTRSTANADQFARHDEALTTADLGEGFNALDDAETNHLCLDFNTSTALLNTSTLKAFYAYSADDLERKVKLAISPKVTVSKVDAQISASQDAMFSVHSVEQVLTIVAKVQTVTRNASPKSSIQDGVCSTTNTSHPYDMAEFLSTCGNSWVSSQTMGGFLILTLDMSSFSSTDKAAIELAAKLNAAGKGVDAGVTLSDLDVLSLTNLAFHIEVAGLPLPGSSLLTTSGDITVSNLLTYLSGLLDDSSDAFSTDPNQVSSAYGTVLFEGFQPYTRSEMANCTDNFSLDDITMTKLTCMNEFLTKAEAYTDVDSTLASTAAHIQWKFSNQDRVRWANPVADQKQAHADWLTRYTSCAATPGGTVANALADCQYELTDRTYDLCGACVMAAACNPASLLAAARGLETSRELPPEDYQDPYDPTPIFTTITGNDGVDLSNVADDLCVLTRVGGAFLGSSESVAVSRAMGNWRLVSNDAWTDEDEALHVAATCVPRSVFFNNDSTNWFDEDDRAVDSEATSTATFTESKLGYALSGIGGELTDTTDGARLDYNTSVEPTLEAVASTFSSGVTATATGFGLKVVKNGLTPDLIVGQGVSTGGSTTAERLIPVSKGLCFLTEIHGEFEGNSDGVFLDVEDGWWTLHVQAECDDDFIFCGTAGPRPISAKARCYKFDQTP